MASDQNLTLPEFRLPCPCIPPSCLCLPITQSVRNAFLALLDGPHSVHQILVGGTVIFLSPGSISPRTCPPLPITDTPPSRPTEGQTGHKAVSQTKLT